jgi:pilus assembly protein FimV
MNSALNEPLRAQIELLSATPEELDNLTVAMASADTFARYGIDRPFYLQDIQFNIIRSGRVDGNVVEIRSGSPMAEPFLTFLVEASWSRGRLLREYTVFLDPPTFAPRSADTAPAVQAPSRSAPADSGRIERAAPPPQQQRPAPASVPRQAAAPDQPKPQPVADQTPYDSVAGGDYLVQRSETLWGIASRVRPDFRLSINQTMLAIFEANPEAFGGNINILRAGAALRIPSADDIFRISRGDALAEAQRQHAEWTGGTVPARAADTSARPSLVLVPPDEELVDDAAGEPAAGTQFDDEPTTRENEIERRIAELEAADVPQQRSLIEIRDNELAALRDELARIRGEIYEPPVDDIVVDDMDDEIADAADPFAEDAETVVDDAEPVEDADTAAADTPPEDIIRAPTRSAPSLLDRAMEIVKSFWTIIVGAVVLVAGFLFWFMRRGRDDDDDPDNWQPLDRDEMSADLSSTESLRAPLHMDESIVVVEQESTMQPSIDATVDAPLPAFEAETEADYETDATGQFGSLEDTFSSETAINLDQTDPIAEADFHMAYGLYDQAADLVNGALSIEPSRPDLLTKLCEIYFVWGNRDAFIDAARRLKATVGSDESADWDKIVIMGQQIAGDDELFAGASAVGATKAVDLSFEAGMDETGSLDMEFVGDPVVSGDVVDLGADDETEALETDGGVDFFIDSVAEESEFPEIEVASESDAFAAPDFDVTREVPEVDETAELPAAESTVETPTIEQQFDVLSGTAELPSLEDTLGDAQESSGQSADATAEINLDDLGLDGLAETELASLDDFDATSENEVLSDTGINEALGDIGDVTGKNPELDPDSTGVQAALSADDTSFNEMLDDDATLAATSEMPAIETDDGIDETLLDATGVTQVLSADLAVDTVSDAGAGLSDDDATMLAAGYGDDTVADSLADDAETLLASLDDDDSVGDFDFAKTEALPKDVFTGNANLDETGELPAVASTDFDLDLDDLTAALQVSEAGDTVEQKRDDATVEQPRPNVPVDDSGTVSLAPDDFSDDLSDARTMTEVGTKLDLARAYVDMGDPNGARSILEEVLDEGDQGQRQQAQQLLDSLPS